MFSNTVKSLLLVLFVIVGFASCQDESTESEVVSTSQSQSAIAFLNNRGNADAANTDSRDTGLVDDICLALNYPITVSVPGGDAIIVNSDDELSQLITDFFDNNPDSEEYPTFQYPISVTKEDGAVVSVSSDKELCDLFEECWEAFEEEWGDEDWDEEDWDEDFIECFDLNFPLTLVFPDGTMTTLNDYEELATALEEYYDTHPEDSTAGPDFQYPITITLADSTVQQIENAEQLEAAFEACYGSGMACFDIKYPIQVQIPEGDIVTVDDEDAYYALIDQWFEDNPESEVFPDFVYPITVVNPDGSEIAVDNSDTLDQLYETCFTDDESSPEARSKTLVSRF